MGVMGVLLAQCVFNAFWMTVSFKLFFWCRDLKVKMPQREDSTEDETEAETKLYWKEMLCCEIRYDITSAFVCL